MKLIKGFTTSLDENSGLKKLTELILPENYRKAYPRSALFSSRDGVYSYTLRKLLSFFPAVEKNVLIKKRLRQN